MPRETIQNVVERINAGRAASGEMEFDICAIDREDALTFRLIRGGRIYGVFKEDWTGLREILRLLAPSRFDDLVAAVSLYRPGPLQEGMMDDLIDRVRGRIEETYPLPRSKGILKSTRGVIVYHEQIAALFRKLAGFDLGESEDLFAGLAISGKKDRTTFRNLFICHAIERGLSREESESAFDVMARFAPHVISKKEALNLSLMFYQAAWLQAHYSSEFMAALMTLSGGDVSGMGRNVRACRDMGVSFLPPDVNFSQVEFTLESGSIRFGLVAFIARAGARGIVLEREKGGPYEGVSDLYRRLQNGAIGRKTMRSLVDSGAFDGIHGEDRSRTMVLLEATLKEEGRAGRPPEDEVAFPVLVDQEKWRREKGILGCFLTGHPLQVHQVELRARGLVDIPSVLMMGVEDRSWSQKYPQVIFAGIIEEKKVFGLPRGGEMAFLTLDDFEGTIEVVLFPEIYSSTKECLESLDPVVVTGKVECGSGSPKVLADALVDLEQFLQETVQGADTK